MKKKKSILKKILLSKTFSIVANTLFLFSAGYLVGYHYFTEGFNGAYPWILIIILFIFLIIDERILNKYRKLVDKDMKIMSDMSLAMKEVADFLEDSVRKEKIKNRVDEFYSQPPKYRTKENLKKLLTK